jgi:hypothetical protein
VIPIDPLFSLATSIYLQPGAYEALIGSGMSGPAGVRTGSELTRELAELVARHEDGSIPDDIDAWWSQKYPGVRLQYGTIVQAMAPTRGQRQALLKSIIEPTQAEMAAGLKVPTPAHHALAELVRSGLVRVILTTNFDRLLETALREVGVEEQMLSGPEDLARMTPIQQTVCTVIKLHGDYQQANLRNTDEELEYSAGWRDMLRRVLDEYGLFTSAGRAKTWCCGKRSSMRPVNDMAASWECMVTHPRRFKNCSCERGRPVWPFRMPTISSIGL